MRKEIKVWKAEEKFFLTFAECSWGHSAKPPVCRVPNAWHSAYMLFASAKPRALGKQ